MNLFTLDIKQYPSALRGNLGGKISYKELAVDQDGIKLLTMIRNSMCEVEDHL